MYQIDEFARSRRVIAVDTRGHGNSPRGTAPFTLRQFADDLADLFQRLGIERADLLGFSDGGNIALLFALKYPELVRSLVLNGANLKPSGVRLSVQSGIALGYALTRVASLFDRRAVPKSELLGLMVKEPHIDPGSLASLKMPVLVIAGSRDMIRESHTRAIAAAIPRATLSIIEGDHFIALKRSGEFNKAVLDFLDGAAEAAPIL